MSNPFEELGADTQPQALENNEYEEVGGAFSCHTQGCYEVASEARYVTVAQVLTWKCKSEHVSFIKDFVL